MVLMWQWLLEKFPLPAVCTIRQVEVVFLLVSDILGFTGVVIAGTSPYIQNGLCSATGQAPPLHSPLPPCLTLEVSTPVLRSSAIRKLWRAVAVRTGSEHSPKASFTQRLALGTLATKKTWHDYSISTRLTPGYATGCKRSWDLV